jgi:UDP-glucose 4-epimerase
MLNHTHSKPTPPSRVVVLGANGFLGRTLVGALGAAAIDHLGISSKDIDLESSEAPAALDALLREGDSIVMLAALTPDRGRDRDTLMRNLIMAANVCRSLESSQTSHVIYMSSDAVYPMNAASVDEQSCAAPEDLYGIMHRTREVMFSDTINDALCVVRPTLIFGAGDPHNSYGPNRLRRMARNDGQIKLFGAGEETRDHIYVSDVAKLLLEILANRSVGTINVATGQSIDFDALARKVAALFDTAVEDIHTDRANPITHRHFDVTALHKAFPTFSPMSLDAALAKVHSETLDGADG